MKLLCLKRIEPYWGVAFEDGKIYESDNFFTQSTTLIIDEENFWKHNELIIKSKNFTQHTQETLHKVIPGYLTRKQIVEKYCEAFESKFLVIKGDDGFNSSFCLSTKEELLENYGSYKFLLTVKLLEDFFIPLANYRQKRIDEIML